MDKLMDYVCEELEKLEKKADKGGLSMSEIQYADTLAHLKKNLLKSEEMFEEMDGEYSGDMRSMAYRGGSYNRSRDGGRSYARGDGRGRGRNARRDSMGRYSSDDGYSRDMEDIADTIRSMMGEMPQEVKRDAERFVSKLEQHM